MKRPSERSDEPDSAKKPRPLSHTARFTVNQRHKFDSKFPHFRQPTEIGAFSLDMCRKFSNNRSQLKYYIQPQTPSCVSFNLRQGYKEMIRKDETTKEYINDILRWILVNFDKFSLRDSKQTVESQKKSRQLNTDVVCWRGLLTKFLCTPYESRDGWLVAVTLYNGTYYMCEFETEEKKKEKERVTERQDEMCCWGWKFEQYLTADTSTDQPNTDIPFNNTEAFCTVVRSRLNSHSLVFSGEVDAVTCDTNAKGKGHYVELKTSREIDNPRQDKNFKRFKLIKWWAQSFLVGIPEIICGFRDDEGVVHRLQSFRTMSLPESAKDLHDAWKPAVCFNFLDQLLTFIKHTVREDDHRVVHLLQWNPREDIQCSKLPPNSDFVFLPDWYINPSVT